MTDLSPFEASPRLRFSSSGAHPSDGLVKVEIAIPGDPVTDRFYVDMLPIEAIQLGQKLIQAGVKAIQEAAGAVPK